MMLTPAQRDILRQMAAGWELSHVHSWFLTKPDAEQPFITERNDALFLRDHRLIEFHRIEVTRKGIEEDFYRLTDAGREAAKGE